MCLINFVIERPSEQKSVYKILLIKDGKLFAPCAYLLYGTNFEYIPGVNIANGEYTLRWNTLDQGVLHCHDSHEIAKLDVQYYHEHFQGLERFVIVELTAEREDYVAHTGGEYAYTRLTLSQEEYDNAIAR